MTDGPEGLLVVDKPPGWTSHDVVGRVRRLAGMRAVGHAGTLDPMATGVLVLGVGRATKLLTFLVGCDKEYTATIRLGAATVTDDAEGDVTSASGCTATEADVERAVVALTGHIEQVPSSVSAIKVGGQRSYARVRGGEDVQLAARPVTVSRFEVLTTRRDGLMLDLDVHVEVSSGTYVRALARDLGVALGCGGHLTALRRTRVGGYAHMHDLHVLSAAYEQALEARGVERLDRADLPPLPVLPLADAAAAVMPVHHVGVEQARALGFGQRIDAGPGGDPVAAIDPTGRLVAILDETGAQARSRVVFPLT